MGRWRAGASEHVRRRLPDTSGAVHHRLTSRSREELRRRRLSRTAPPDPLLLQNRSTSRTAPGTVLPNSPPEKQQNPSCTRLKRRPAAALRVM
ncbi:hypothetical protein FQA47_024494 [Oryzias melastigma]|uniref:Uncharacterized protein n=1 Tax=Oryzias melastigma TaxID=30732 RepID=A0A834F1C4_ORYME|nr:hypothetical protein FQA47_024494 [Oryzias melastigma]